MKVLIHGDMDHGQMVAIWRCRHLLEGMGIELHPFNHAMADEKVVLLIHSKVETWPEFLDTPFPVVLVERIDGAQLSAPVRKHIGHPNLKVVIKNTIYADWNYYNLTTWRAHENTCRAAMGEPVEAPVCNNPITLDHYNKLKLGFSFVAYPHYDALRDIHAGSWPNKTIDLHFAGTTDYGGMPWLNWHRRSAVNSVLHRRCPQICHSDRAMQFQEYFATMRQSRFVVSPWGLGEPCYRDFEAMLCGCMIIKPDTTYIKTVPAQFYQIPSFSRCVCKPDFSDLGEILDSVQEISVGDKILWANWVLDQNSTESIARRLAKIFREAVS